MVLLPQPLSPTSETKTALRDGQGHIVQDGALLLVTKSDMLQRKGAVGRVGSLFRHLQAPGQRAA